MHENPPKISVIFPIYNNENYVRRCILSVINQTLKDIELILIDDGSTDSTVKIIDELAEADSRIRVVHKKNEGQSIAMNLGIDMARGEYIAFVESDDSTEKHMYEKLYDRAQETNADIVKCGFYYCRDGVPETEFTKFYDIAEEYEVFKAKERPNIFQYHASIWGGLYRRKFLNENGIRFLISPKASYADFSWRTLTFAYAERLTVLHAPLYYYEIENPESSFRKISELYKYKLFHANESIKILHKMKIFEEVREDLAVQIFGNCINEMRNITPHARHEYFSQLREICADLFQGEFKFKYFGNRRRYIVELLLKGDFENFFDLLYMQHYMYESELIYGKKVVLFGAGECGKSFFTQLKRSGISIIKWVDNHPEIFPGIEPAESLLSVDFDMILVAVSKEEMFNEIKEQLSRMGIANKKIIWRLPMTLS